MRMPPFRSLPWMKRKIGPAAEDRVDVYELRDHQDAPWCGEASYCRPAATCPAVAKPT